MKILYCLFQMFEQQHAQHFMNYGALLYRRDLITPLIQHGMGIHNGNVNTGGLADGVLPYGGHAKSGTICLISQEYTGIWFNEGYNDNGLRHKVKGAKISSPNLIDSIKLIALNISHVLFPHAHAMVSLPVNRKRNIYCKHVCNGTHNQLLTRSLLLEFISFKVVSCDQHSEITNYI